MLRAWLKASRPPSQTYLFFPLLLGQALAQARGAKLSAVDFVLVHVFGLLDQLYIVYANDVADRETDRENQTPTAFSGGSRVLVDGDLQPKQLARAAWIAAVLCLALGGFWALGRDRPWALALVAIAVVLLWMYSFGPVRLSYRGGGELLQTLGVGAVLPLLGYYVQAGELGGFPWAVLAVLAPTHLGCAMATALPDEPSDRAHAKRTMAVLLGARATAALVAALNLVSVVALFRGALLGAPAPWVVAVVPSLSVVGMLAFFGGKPGTRRLAAFVFFAILATVSLTAGMAIGLFCGGP